MKKDAKTDAKKLPAGAWGPWLQAAGVLTKELAEAKGTHQKAILIGQFLSPLVDREVKVTVAGRTGRATLRTDTRRAREKCYFFEVAWDAPAEADPPEAPPKPHAKPNIESRAKPKTASSAPAGRKSGAGPGPRTTGNDEQWD